MKVLRSFLLTNFLFIITATSLVCNIYAVSGAPAKTSGGQYAPGTIPPQKGLTDQQAGCTLSISSFDFSEIIDDLLIIQLTEKNKDHFNYRCPFIDNLLTTFDVFHAFLRTHLRCKAFVMNCSSSAYGFSKPSLSTTQAQLQIIGQQCLANEINFSE